MLGKQEPSPDLVLVDGEVSKKETAVKVVETALKHFGRIDLLVNNAGIFIPKAFTDYTEEDYNLVMNTKGTEQREVIECRHSFRQ
jgi:NAD(P)-dependent dehydrogenase (short-subunit alcohol dehydrogenase family)